MLTYADVCSASAASSNSALHLSQLNAQLNGAATTLAHDRARRLSRYTYTRTAHIHTLHTYTHCTRSNYLSSRPCPPPQQVHTRHTHTLHTYTHCTHTHTAHVATALAHDRARRLSRYTLDIHTHCTHAHTAHIHTLHILHTLFAAEGCSRCRNL